MKIGVLTFFRLANYGANLQAFSTYCYLKNNKHDVLFIDWEPDDYFKTKVEKAVLDTRKRHHFDFVDRYLPVSAKCTNDEDICKVIENENIDAVIIGSDAVLQHHPYLERLSILSRRFISVRKTTSTTTFPSAFWGSFIHSLSKKIPVAVMSGCNQDSFYFYIMGKERRLMGESVARFSYISVRDEWTKKMIKRITKGEIIPQVTPDPVFALKANALQLIPSKEEVVKKYCLPEKYVLFSFWSNNIVSYEWLDKLGKMFQADGLEPVAFPMPGGVDFRHPFSYTVDTPMPLDWYSIIANASAYIGEKMHPIVTCLANAVPCFNFDHCGAKFFKGLVRYSKSSKIYHIMNEFGFGDNRVNGSGIFFKPPKPEVVYDRIKNFDTNLCSHKAEIYLNRYYDMMTNIIETFKKVVNE